MGVICTYQLLVVAGVYTLSVTQNARIITEKVG